MWIAPAESFCQIRSAFLLGEIFRIQGYENFKTPWYSVLMWTLASVMVLIAIWTIAVQFAKWYKKPTCSTKKLFSHLVRKHRLSSKEVALMNQLAKTLPPSVPAAVLFVEPTYWSSVPNVQKEDASQLVNKIFGSAIQNHVF